MKKIVLFVLLMTTLCLGAQTVQVVKQCRLLPSWIGQCYRPVLNANGDKMLFSDAMASDLYLYDFASSSVTKVSDEAGSGIGAFFGGDGKVYYVTQERNERNLIYRTGHSYDISQAQHKVILEARHGAVHPVVAVAGAGLKGEQGFFSSPAMNRAAVYTEGSELAIIVNGKEHRYTPVESDAGYLWASLSPDGSRVAVYAAGKGIVVTDLQGRVLSELGVYEMPSWLNDDYLVAQNASDDGYQFTSSQIVLIKVDGSFFKPLTSPTSMTMYPSAAAGRVVYSSIDGYLYMMELNILEQ